MRLTDCLIDKSIGVLFNIEDHITLPVDRNPEPGYNTLLLRLIPGDLLSACRVAL